MVKNNKPVKKTVKKTKTKKVKKTITNPVVESTGKKKSFWKKILEYILAPAVFIAFISSAPQLLDKAIAFYHNMSYEDYIIAQRQLKYWSEHADCINFDAVVVTNSASQIKLRMCNNDLILAEFKDKTSKKLYSWIDLGTYVTAKNSTFLIGELLALPQNQAQGGLHARVETQTEKVLCKTETPEDIVYYLMISSNSCQMRKINKLHGTVEESTANCNAVCK